jgi:hypothetical protein
VFKQVITSFALAGALVARTAAPAKAPSAPSAAAKPAAAVPPSQVDTVIQLVKGGMSEALIIRTLQRENKTGQSDHSRCAEAHESRRFREYYQRNVGSECGAEAGGDGGSGGNNGSGGSDYCGGSDSEA